jgi:hypothetical protein
VVVVVAVIVIDNDSKNRKMTKKIEIEMIVDSIYAICFIIWRKKIFFPWW